MARADLSTVPAVTPIEVRYEVPGWGVGELWRGGGLVLANDFGFGPVSDTVSDTRADDLIRRVHAFLGGEDVAFSHKAQTFGGGLQNFTVAAAPSGSFDASLGAAGIPLFALDLRNAPPSLREPRLTRSIGAVFANEMESNYLMRASVPTIFDAILFVENTTAARPVVRR